MAVAFCLMGLVIGALVTASVYGRELKRMARFLRTRNPQSNQRLTVQAPGGALAELARQINRELDDMQAERTHAAQSREEFQRDLASLSHDIRTPLTGAKGFLQLAQDDLASREQPACAASNEAASYLSAAIVRLDDMNALLDQLFAYTRTQDPDATLANERTLVFPVLTDALLGHYPEFEKRHWEPRASFQDEAMVVYADEDALARIFNNLIDNALRYGSSPLSITQEARTITFANEVDDASSIDVARLFERFYRADTARATRGTGLGLAVCAQLAKAMGMSMEAHVENSTFAISLTLPEPPATERATQQMAKNERQG